MSDALQITYMQTRLVRLATETWQIPMQEVNEIFTANNVYRYIEDMWELFHIQGDMAVLDDITEYLHNRGVKV